MAEWRGFGRAHNIARYTARTRTRAMLVSGRGASWRPNASVVKRRASSAS